MQQLGSQAKSNRDQAATERSKRRRRATSPLASLLAAGGGGRGGLGFGLRISLSPPREFASSI